MKFVILGCGSSMGVPRPDGYFGNCDPEIKKIKDNLYNAGALYSSMSGSGSSVFGIFNSEKTIPLLLPENYFVKELACQF